MDLTPAQERAFKLELKEFMSISCRESSEHGEYLVATPDAIFTMNRLHKYMACFRDISLRIPGHDTNVKHLRCLDSLRASFFQLKDGVDTVARAANASVNKVQRVVSEMVLTYFDIMKTLKNPQLMPDLPNLCKKMSDFPIECYNISEKIHHGICEQLEVSEEIIRLAILAQEREEKDGLERAKEIKLDEKKSESVQAALNKKNEEYRKQKQNEENAMKLKKEEMEKNSSFWRVLGAKATDSIIPVVAVAGITTAAVINPLAAVPVIVAELAAVANNWIKKNKTDQPKLSAMQKLDKNVEDARIHLQEERQKAETLRKEVEAAEKELLEAFISMKTTNSKHAGFDDFIKYMETFCYCLENTRNAWKDWMEFWSKISETIHDSLIKNVEEFLRYTASGTSNPALEEYIRRYGSRICALESVLIQRTELYKTISKKFIMPILRSPVDTTHINNKDAEEILKSLSIVKFQAGVQAEIEAHNQRLPGEVMKRLIEKGFDLNDTLQ